MLFDQGRHPFAALLPLRGITDEMMNHYMHTLVILSFAGSRTRVSSVASLARSSVNKIAFIREEANGCRAARFRARGRVRRGGGGEIREGRSAAGWPGGCAPTLASPAQRPPPEGGLPTRRRPCPRRRIPAIATPPKLIGRPALRAWFRQRYGYLATSRNGLQ